MAPVLMTSIYQTLLKLAETAEQRVILVSPFLSIPVARALSEIAKLSRASWTILTHLEVNSVASGYLSVDALKLLASADVRVRHLDRLHAKAYVMDDVAIVGSGNLTWAGLGAQESSSPNTELNYVLSNAESRETIAEVANWVSNSEKVSGKRLNEIESQARQIVVQRLPKTNQGGRKAPESMDRSFWVKLHYGFADWNLWRDEAWFSNAKRASIKRGDLILIAAQEDSAVHAIVEATSDARYDLDVLLDADYSEEEANRWPWVTDTTPWLVPPSGVLLSYKDLDIRGSSLQNGYRRIGVAEFSKAVEYFEASSNAQ